MKPIASSILGTLFVALTVAMIVGAELITIPGDYGNVTHVTYWEKWTGFESDAMKAVVDKYNAGEGKKKHIFVEFLPVGDIEAKVLIATSGEMPPDIAGLDTLDVAAFADNNAILTLDSYCKQYGIKEDDYIPTAWKMMFYRNHVFALPTTPDSNALHYNRAEYKAAGLDPNKPPQTFDELDAISEKLTTKDAKGNYVQFGFIPSDPGWWNWGWGYFFGGTLWDGKDKITCNSPENIRAWEWVASYSKKYGATAMSSFKSGFSFGSAADGFISAKESMQLQGVWMYNFITQFNPKLDWAAAPFPHPADRPDLANMTFADSDNIVIPVGAKHPKEAFDFMAFVQRQPNMELLCMGQRKGSPLAKVSDWFWKNHPNPYIRLFSDLPKQKSARTPPMMGIFNEYNDAIGEAFDEVCLLQKTPKEALDGVHDRIQQVLDHYIRISKLRQAAGG